MNTKAYLFISGTVFGVVGVFHGLRLLNNWPAHIGLWDIPLNVSWLGLLVAGSLCIWAYRLAFKA